MAVGDPKGEPASGRSSRSQHTVSRRDLIRVVLRDTLRMNGIPIEWITCEVYELAGRPLHCRVVLVIQHWHDGLLRYAPVLQRQLLDGLRHFDPANDHSGHVVDWEFGENCVCPHEAMPAPAYWKLSAEQARLIQVPSGKVYQRDYDDYVPTVPSALP